MVVMLNYLYESERHVFFLGLLVALSKLGMSLSPVRGSGKGWVQVLHLGMTKKIRARG